MLLLPIMKISFRFVNLWIAVLVHLTLHSFLINSKKKFDREQASSGSTARIDDRRLFSTKSRDSMNYQCCWRKPPEKDRKETKERAIKTLTVSRARSIEMGNAGKLAAERAKLENLSESLAQLKKNFNLMQISSSKFSNRFYANFSNHRAKKTFCKVICGSEEVD